MVSSFRLAGFLTFTTRFDYFAQTGEQITSMMRLFLFVLILTAAASWGGLTPAAAQPAPVQEGDFTGLWKGTIRVFPCSRLRERGRCNAVNNVSFTIIQDGSKISGHYTCSIGTYICRNGNADNGGKIVSGDANGKNIRFTVIVPSDVSSCRYNGVSLSRDQMRGAYTCYVGGGIAEQGRFDVMRE
jgi:hypothetical protein